MWRKFGTAGAAIVGAAVMLPVLAGAAPLDTATIYEPISTVRFCAEHQAGIANLDPAVLAAQQISLSGTYYSNVNSFVTSKSSVRTDPDDRAIMTTQFISYRDAAKTRPDMIRCKFRTGESLDKGAWPAESDNNSPGYEVEPVYGFGPTVGAGLSTDPANDKTCATVNQQTIDTVWSTLTPEDKAASPYKPAPDGTTLVTEPDTIVPTGPDWTSAFPTLKVVGSNLVVPSKAIVVPTTENPPRFTGAHYCTLVSPQYLRAVLLGQDTVA